MVSGRTGPPAGRQYELKVQEHIGQYWSTWLDALSMTHQDDGTTTLRGEVTDEAELHGLLTKVRDLNMTLVSIAVIDLPHPAYRPPAQSSDITATAQSGLRVHGRGEVT